MASGDAVYVALPGDGGTGVGVSVAERTPLLYRFEDVVHPTEPVVLDFDQVRSLEEDPTGKRATAMQGLASVVQEQFVAMQDFVINMPPSVFEQPGTKSLTTEDIFKPPPYFDELHTLGLTRLTRDQLNQIQRTGSFDVPSQKFPNRAHVWRVSQLVQKGRENIRNDAHENYAGGCYLLCINLPNRVKDSGFSIKDAFQHLGTIGWDLVSLLIGLPERMPRYTEYEVEEILVNLRRRYLLAMLTPTSEKGIFTTAKGERIDLRLQYEPVSKVLDQLYSKVNSDAQMTWNRIVVQQRVQIEAEIIAATGQPADKDMFDQRVANMLSDRRNEFFFKSLRDHVAANGPAHIQNYGLVDRVAQELRANMVVSQAIADSGRLLREAQHAASAAYKAAHPILGRVTSMVESAVQAEARRLASHREQALDQIVKNLRDAGCNQEATLAEAEIKFMREEEPHLRKELEAEVRPRNLHEYNRRIWNPKNWRIVKNKDTTYEYNRYSVYKQATYSVSTAVPLWRVIAALMRYAAWVPNIFFYLIFANLWGGPFGIRGLLWPDRFFPETEVNTSTGKLEKSSLSFNTMISLIASLWSSIAQSRDEFERQPDSGLLPKNLSRVFNVVWNYLFKGLIGTIMILVWYLVVCPINICISLAMGIMCPFWYFALNILLYLFMIFIFDFESSARFGGCCDCVACCDGSIRDSDGYRVAKRRIRNHMFPIPTLALRLAFALLELALSLVLGFVVGPVISLLIFIFATLRRITRTCYDSCCMCCILRPRARVPINDNFLARRIAGPGFGSQIFASISVDQAILEVQRELERRELDVFSSYMQSKISIPSARYAAFANQIASLLGGSSLNFDYDKKERLFHDTAFSQKLSSKVDKRRNLLRGVISVVNYPIRMRAADLSELVRRTRRIIEPFYVNRVFPMMDDNERALVFSRADVVDKDWDALSLKIISAAFGAAILTPLEEADETCQLVIEHVDVSTFVSMVMTGDAHDDLDRAHAQVTPVTGKKQSQIVEVTFGNQANIQITDPFYMSYGVSVPQELERISYDMGTLSRNVTRQSIERYLRDKEKNKERDRREHTCGKHIGPVDLDLQDDEEAREGLGGESFKLDSVYPTKIKQHKIGGVGGNGGSDGEGKGVGEAATAEDAGAGAGVKADEDSLSSDLDSPKKERPSSR